MCTFRKRVQKLLKSPEKPMEKLQALSEIAKDLLDGEWVQILNEFEKAPQLLHDCLNFKENKAEIMTIVESLVDLAGDANFRLKNEIDKILDTKRNEMAKPSLMKKLFLRK